VEFEEAVRWDLICLYERALLTAKTYGLGFKSQIFKLEFCAKFLERKTNPQRKIQIRTPLKALPAV